MLRRDEALSDLGKYIRTQRELAKLSLRTFARLTNVSDSYLSQVERGLYQPSPEVLRAIATGLRLQPDALYRRMGWLTDDAEPEVGVIDAIRSDAQLTQAQKSALITSYQAMAGGS